MEGGSFQVSFLVIMKKKVMEKPGSASITSRSPAQTRRERGSNEYPYFYILSRNMKKKKFIRKFSFFGGRKFSVYLNRLVFVMLDLVVRWLNCFLYLFLYYHIKKRLTGK